MVKSFYGLNIAVKDLASATERYEKVLGIKAQNMPESTFAFPGLTGSFFDLGGPRIHLIASLNENTSVAKFIEKKGEGLFLISVLVSDLQQESERMKSVGALFVSEKPISVPLGKVNFLHPKSMNGVQVEVLELTQG